MPLYRPSELRAWLQENGLTPKRGLSQNFLIDGHVVEKIVSFADPQSGDLIIEIGPGPGVLTEVLCSYTNTLIAIEADSQFAKLLPRLGSVEVLHQDALKTNWQQLLSQRLVRGQKATIVSNLPYHLSTAIMKLLLPLGYYVRRLVLMVQKEFSHRLMACPGPQPYGPISILREHYSTICERFDVSASCFYPPPSVCSTVLKIDLKDQPAPTLQKLSFDNFLELIFAQRRKCLGSILHKLFSISFVTKWQKYRAEQLSYSQLHELFMYVLSYQAQRQ